MNIQTRLFAIVLLTICITSLFSHHSQVRANSLTQALDRLVQQDARSWVFNRYVRGSMRNVRILSRRGSRAVVYGEYTYNRNRVGWVKVRLRNNRLDCMEYWDFRGVCRKMGQTQSRRIISEIIAGAIAGANSSDGHSSGNTQRRPRQQCCRRVCTSSTNCFTDCGFC